ncbi:MAG: hypothetical protein ACOYL5_20170, partial [Phototrophicaceae bacterium]
MKFAPSKLVQPLTLAGLSLSLIPIVQLWLYIQTYAANVVRWDDAFRSMNIALAVKVGTFSWGQLTQAVLGQVSIPTYSIVALLTITTGWNVFLESAIGFALMVGVFLLLLILLWHTDQRLLAVAALPTAVILFTPQQSSMWVVGYTVLSFGFVGLFIFGALSLLVLKPNPPFSLAGAIVLAVVATFSHGQGVTVWPLMILALWLNGTRRIWPYVWVIVVGGLAFGGYLWLIRGGDSLALTFDLPRMARYAFAFLGNSADTREEGNAIVAGQWGLALMVANLWVIYRSGQYRRFFQVWLPIIGYSLLCTVLVTLTRFDSGESPLTGRYAAMSAYFWIGLVISSVLVIWLAQERPSGLRYGVVLVNLGLWVFWGGVHLQGVNANAGRVLEQVRFLNERCDRQFIFVQDVPQIDEQPCVIWHRGETNLMAYHELTTFYHMPKHNILADYTLEDALIVVEGADVWGNLQTQKWLLDDLPTGDVLHHVTDLSQLNQLPPEFVALADWTDDTNTIQTRLEDYAYIWHIRLSTVEESPFWATLLEAGYLPTRFTYRTAEGVAFVVTNYRNINTLTDVNIQFGDDIHLVGWNAGEFTVAPCESITVGSLWETDTPLADGYSATLTLDRITGVGAWDFETLVRRDTGLGIAPSETWQVGQRYFDERTIDIPCDVPNGDYMLQMGVYNYRDATRLPITVV